MTPDEHRKHADQLLTPKVDQLRMAPMTQAHALVAIADELAQIRSLLEQRAAPRRPGWWSRVMSR